MNLKDANKLFLEGQIALAEIESNGIHIDTDYLDSAIAKVTSKINKYQEKMKESKIWGTWKRVYGPKANLGSRPQLGRVLFDELKIKYPGREKTKSGRYSTDEVVLSQLEIPFVRRFIKLEGFKKLRKTYLVRLREETVDGYYHPEHHLNTVTTYRSSADGIQTIPKRDEWARNTVRKSFVPRPGHVLVTTDYGSHEFRGAAMFWNDKAMMEYASNPKLDIHRDMAAEMFLCEPEQVNSDTRYLGKNGWVFPRLYGSYYVKISQAVWPEINGKTVRDIPLKDWLASKGITERGLCDPHEPPVEGTFEHHLLQVQKKFDQMFPTWATGRDEWYNLYRKRGWFRHPTGFVQRGLYSRNDLMNHPIQGSLFHCLVWSLIRLVRKELKEHNLKTKILAEIHDEILADVPQDELQGYLNLVERVMTVDIRKEWKWLTVPLLMEAKCSDVSWADMKTMEKKEETWQLKI